ncbi:alpha/beta hydrolase [Xenophilus arseniciresistens]|uniref:Alpha/beta hydrolase n=1 Tax=Xenophilus arseniciresistens TaxID=1283306 RepID=A0AAE3N6G8_9BURK|nr:alpha/beta hydrolase [Xenophilus arseniciresistens]MDA7415404.1 alpha/beta hydrolase [Xenophilus arseniciresistens]
MRFVNKTLAAATLSLLAAAVHAEPYQGVLDFQGQLSRAEVQAQAVAQAHAPNQNINASSIALGPLPQSRDRASVRAEAVAAAHDPRQNLNRSAFADSQVPATYLASPAPAALAGTPAAQSAQ